MRPLYLSVLTSQAVKMIEHPRIAIAIPDFINLYFFILLLLPNRNDLLCILINKTCTDTMRLIRLFALVYSA